jgi:hypothetical protein
MARCALCKQRMNVDAQSDVIYGRNPKTFRLAWMHYICAAWELETLNSQPSRSPHYENRYDEYLHRFEED